MLLDMEISQKICKIVPYTNANANNEYYTSSEDDSQEEFNDTIRGARRRRKSKHKTESLFYNLTHRDKFVWSKIHVQKLIYHKPSAIMFIFCNYRKGHEILNLLKKIYKFAP
jgi:hypothetical protein